MGFFGRESMFCFTKHNRKQKMPCSQLAKKFRIKVNKNKKRRGWEEKKKSSKNRSVNI